MDPNLLAQFESDLAGATDINETDKARLKQAFFMKHIVTDPEWGQTNPEIRFKFAKKFGVSPGFAQQDPGEFYRQGLLPTPKGDLGEAGEPSMFLDPVNALTGMSAALLAKAPFIGATLAARNPLIREAAKQGLLKSGLDWQTMGLHRLPGWIGRAGYRAYQNAPEIMSRIFRAPMPQPRPQLALPPARPWEMPPSSLPAAAAEPAARPRIRYGPQGVEFLP